MAKSKLQITSGKQSKVRLGASTSDQQKNVSPLMPKKNYKKKGAEAVDFGNTGFGTTGMESESK